MSTVDLRPVKAVEITLVEEKTTNHELLHALGSPVDASTYSMTWRESDDFREYFVVNYVQKDGTSFTICIGRKINCKDRLIVYYDGIWTGMGDSKNPLVDHNANRNIVTDVNFY